MTRTNLPHASLCDLLLRAYQPCCNFGVCRDAVWAPERGHVPRGFLGATRGLEDVRAVMVFAEPGFPYSNESYDASATPSDILELTVSRTYRSLSSGQDVFHRNVRWFMAQVCPGLGFDDQLRHIWLTEGRLCSFSKEIGASGDAMCSKTHLLPQLALMPQAKVIAFGSKAKSYLNKAKIDHIAAYALAPPGANHTPARPSWLAALKAIGCAT